MISLAERYRLPISQRTRTLLVAIILVLLVGVALAATRPGNLGDDDGDRTAAGLTSTTEPGDTTDTSAAQATTTTEPTDGPDTTDPDPDPDTDGSGAGGNGSASPTTTTAPGSGLGAEGSGSAGQDDLADTGGLPLAVPGALLLAAAALSRRLTAR